MTRITYIPRNEPAPEIKKVDDRPRSPVQRLQGKKVLISLVTGDRVEGVLREVWQYEVAVQTTDGFQVILKHAIVKIREVSV